MSFSYLPIIFCILMSVNDIIMESSVKLFSLHNQYIFIIIAIIIYSLQPLLFYYVIKNSEFGIAEMNIYWNIVSSILVTIIGIYYFKEKINNFGLIGIILGVLSVILLNYKEN